MTEPLSANFLDIDGSFLEGGGQILRVALGLSCILKQPVRIVKIRANRPKPGLSHQHLHGVNLLRDISNAKVKGNCLHSTEVEFTPRTINSGTYNVDTNTAASITLIYQMVMPVLLYGANPSNVVVRGGTNVSYSPQVEYMQHVLQPNLQQFGITFDLKVLRYGFYPRGNGLCSLKIEPVSSLQAVQLTNFGNLQQVSGWAFCAGLLPASISRDMQQTALCEVHRMWSDGLCNIQALKLDSETASDNGAGILMTALTSTGCVLGVASLGEKKFDGHTLGFKTSCELVNIIQSNTCVDNHMQDQLIIYMALAKGTSRILTGPLSQHTRTAIFVVEVMTGVKFQIDYDKSNHTLISCTGIGHGNQTQDTLLK